MINKKTTVPKNLINRFKTKVNTNNSCKLKLNCNFNQFTFSVNELPKLPVTSDSLYKLLSKYTNSRTTKKNHVLINKYKNKTKKKSMRKINGFIAYRLFYSRSIPSIKYQREFSVQLGKLWINESNKMIWERYAQEYNENILSLSGDLDFVDWLCQSLNIDLIPETTIKTNIVQNDLWSSYTNNFKNTVEDIYIIH